MERFLADLHIHSCLSPCAELDMTPLRIIRRAVEKGLDIIAIADHNSAENVATALSIAGQAGIRVFPAMEVSSREEVHVLAFFGSAEAALAMQEKVYGGLPDFPGGRRDWQVVVNEKDEVLGLNGKLLMAATGFKLEELIGEIRSLGGLAVASHVDRGAFSVSSQMGFVPEGLRFDAVEVIDHRAADAALVFHPDAARLTFSDAHRLEDVGARTTSFFMEEASFEELALALSGEGGRSADCRKE